MKKFILVSLTSLLLFSCSQDDLPDFNKIDSPRVIALIADHPEASPGDTITVTPVISDLQATTGLQDSVQVCVDLGISQGASPTCEGNPTKVVVQNRRTLTLPGLAENWTGAADTATFVLPLEAVIFNQRSSQDQYNGVNYLVEYTLHSPSGVDIKAIKRIAVTLSTKTTKNLNPVLTDIFSDGVSLVSLPINRKVNLTHNLDFSSAENFSIMKTDGNLKNYTEQLIVTWFITDGTTKYFRSEVGVSNEYTGPTAAPTGRSSYVLAVAHDNRGGAVFIKRKLN